MRSLQNLLSFAVFLLIYFRFDALRSCFLLGLAGATALLCNLCRALTLSFVFLNYGESTQVSWHDTIGNFYVILSMALMFIYAWYVKPAEKLDDLYCHQEIFGHPILLFTALLHAVG